MTLILDSGVPFADQFMAPCLQKQWREVWKIDAAFPPDRGNCKGADGGGILNLVFVSAKKYPAVKLGNRGGELSHGEVHAGHHRLTPGSGALRWPVRVLLHQCIKHMYSQFEDYYQPISGGVTLASWETDLLAGTAKNIGP